MYDWLTFAQWVNCRGITQPCDLTRDDLELRCVEVSRSTW
jgi:hypothetical protein